jgi:DNA-binding CsgD family transcriptional regulator
MVMAASPVVRRGQLVAAVERLGHAELDGAVLVRRLADLLRTALPCRGLLLLRTDPTTVLPTEGVVEELPPALCKPFWDNELLETDVNKFVVLARSEVPAATLLQATDGELSRSHRFVSMYSDLGITDELRASFTARDGSCWGIAQLVRVGGATFSPWERDLLAEVAPGVAAALRSGFLAGAPGHPQWAGPALVILNRSGEIESITPEAREWLSELGSATPMAPVPEAVYAVAGRAQAARAGLAGSPACAQVRTARSGWLHLHASCLEGGNGVGVVITPSQAPDLVPLLALCYRLTHREQEVLEFLARGMTTVEITRRLGISAHTVRDHIKALFVKVGVRSRAELVARIFAEHYFDRLEASVDRR